ncbi:flavin reductase family protein [Streptomyces sp. NPDC057543]|uniref:flavin reductase family protein n=1 Tax=Streptomyces sp. NPDC057543 TaxID=3346163 RepID=UPI00367B4286
MLGLGNSAQTTANLLREGECVLNLPSSAMVDAVDRIALTTGKPTVPDHKVKQGYRYEPDKFSTAQLTEQESELVRAPRVAEWPIQLECRVVSSHPLGSPLPRPSPSRSRSFGLISRRSWSSRERTMWIRAAGTRSSRRSAGSSAVDATFIPRNLPQAGTCLISSSRRLSELLPLRSNSPAFHVDGQVGTRPHALMRTIRRCNP